MKFKKYVAPKSLKEALDILHHDDNSIVLGGTTFLRLNNREYSTAVDLKNLNLDYIKETEDEIQIGAYTTLRDLETNKIIHDHFGNYFSQALRNIVGVQFRNTATIGGSVFSRLGFSETITFLLVLNCKLDLYESGTISLQEFISQRDLKNDILKELRIKKIKGKYSYQTMQNSAEDIPVLSVAAAKKRNYTLAIGSRPMLAAIPKKAMENLNSGSFTKDNLQEIVKTAVAETKFGRDHKASAEYRQKIARVLVRKALLEVME